MIGENIMGEKEILEKLAEIISEYADIDSSEVNSETNIRTDLGLNSLELVNIAVAIEDEFDVDIPDREALGIETADDVVKLIIKYLD